MSEATFNYGFAIFQILFLVVQLVILWLTFQISRRK
jgi:hypothetical protein